MQYVPSSGEKSLRNSLQANANKLTSRIFVYFYDTVYLVYYMLIPSNKVSYVQALKERTTHDAVSKLKTLLAKKPSSYKSLITGVAAMINQHPQ